MSAPAAANAAPAKKGGKLIWIILCVVCLAAGGAVPMVVDVPALLGNSTEGKTEKKKKKAHEEEKTATVPFGDVVVNLSEERMTRYLRVKIVLEVGEEDAKTAEEKVTKQKALLKSWLIGHLAGKTLKDVSGTVGVNRLQREILERFEDVLYPHGEPGETHLRNVLFEEYVVQ